MISVFKLANLHMYKKIKRYKILFLLMVTVFLLSFGYLYQEKYLKCLTKDFSFCINSKRYESANGRFSLRYPKEYPLAFKTGDELVSRYHLEGKYTEIISFSREFISTTKSDKFGTISVEKKTSYQNIKEYGDKVLDDHNKLPEQLRSLVPSPRIEYLNIGGEKAVHVTTSPILDTYVFIHEGELYEIIEYKDNYSHKFPSEYYQKGKELILSTFTFNN